MITDRKNGQVSVFLVYLLTGIEGAYVFPYELFHTYHIIPAVKLISVLYYAVFYGHKLRIAAPFTENGAARKSLRRKDLLLIPLNYSLSFAVNETAFGGVRRKFALL